MMKKWIAVNLLLLAIAALIGWQLRKSILRFNTENDVGKIVPVQSIQQRASQQAASPKVLSPGNYNPADFAVIPEKNLFVDSRKREEKAVEPTASPEPPPLTQKPVLVGIAIVDNQRTASILEPGSAPARGERSNRAQLKKIGDVYQGYTITEIDGDRIVLQNGTRKEIIPLHEGSKRASPGKTPIQATRIVYFGAGATGGGATAMVVSSSPAAASPPRTQVTPVGSSTGPGQPSGIQPAPAPARGVQQPAAPQARPAPPQSPGTEGQEMRTIRTPFGTITRPNR